MMKKSGMILLGLLTLELLTLKNSNAQTLDGQKVPVASQKPSMTARRKAIPFPSMCGFFKGQVSLNRSQAIKKKADFILVSKRLHRLVLFNGDSPLKSYHISLGFTPVGKKLNEGDGKTPEGQYLIDFKNWNSQFHRSLRVSYPNARDRARAARAGVEPGGNIMIHGEHYDEDKRELIRDYIQNRGGVDWTHGCMAVMNHDIDEIYRFVALNTFIEICP